MQDAITEYLAREGGLIASGQSFDADELAENVARAHGVVSIDLAQAVAMEVGE